MNIHPLFVHFPIALLTIYAILELVSPWCQRRASWLRESKILLLLVGFVALLPTLLAGEEATHLLGESELIERHELFAQLTTLLFTILAGAYALGLLKHCKLGAKLKDLLERVNLWSLLCRVRTFVLTKHVRMLLALLALSCITITGALGASIVYGTQVDPFVSFIFNLVM